MGNYDQFERAILSNEKYRVSQENTGKRTLGPGVGKQRYKWGFCCVLGSFNAVENIDEAYRDYSWNSYIGTQCPGFIEYGDKITYEANPLNFDSCLNIVQYREFYGIKPNYVEISEEFRLLNNLYHDINTNIFYEIEENGECTEVAKIINNDCAYIKLKSLMKFAAAKQMALLLFFDIRVKISGSLQKNGLKEFSTTINEDGLFFGLWGGEQRLLETYSYSILMGKRILLPKPVEECGYEPYSRNEENEYPNILLE